MQRRHLTQMLIRLRLIKAMQMMARIHRPAMTPPLATGKPTQMAIPHKQPNLILHLHRLTIARVTDQLRRMLCPYSHLHRLQPKESNILRQMASTLPILIRAAMAYHRKLNLHLATLPPTKRRQ